MSGRGAGRALLSVSGPTLYPGCELEGEAVEGLSFVWLEITGRCQLECTHCYADSSPRGGHGAMAVRDWVRVMDEAAALGTRMVQFIGGEPTLHDGLPTLIRHALARDLRVEVYSNLVHVTDELWNVFGEPGVGLATSYYSDDAAQHAEITRRRGTHARTKANIVEALRRSVPLRVGLIDVSDGQRVAAAEAELRALGVTEIGRDRLRQVGRGVRDAGLDVAELCGDCARGKVAVSPAGDVWPCVFSRWMPVGNVRERGLGDIVASPEMRRAEVLLADASPQDRCNPRCCPSTMCDPQCSPSCSPSCRPAGNCRPSGNCAPAY